MIKCRKCGIEKKEDGYYKRKNGQIRHPCKECFKSDSKAYYKKFGWWKKIQLKIKRDKNNKK